VFTEPRTCATCSSGLRGSSARNTRPPCWPIHTRPARSRDAQISQPDPAPTLSSVHVAPPSTVRPYLPLEPPTIASVDEIASTKFGSIASLVAVHLPSAWRYT
jgi:hypothetical protein